MNSERELMMMACAEIEGLRRENAKLAAYFDHTERLLALFEGGPRQQRAQGESPDVVWLMRKHLSAMDAKLPATDG